MPVTKQDPADSLTTPEVRLRTTARRIKHMLHLSGVLTAACMGAGCGGDGSGANDNVPPPSISLTPKPLGVGMGGTTTLTWEAENASSCTASGAWVGSRAVSGSETSLPLTATASFSLNCVGDGGAATVSAQVPVLRPNVVVITTDDQTLESIRVMPKTLSLIAAQGTTFRNSLASSPLCAPSRATFLTGQYSHNHKVYENDRPLGYFALDQENTLPVWLRSAGYRTAHIGKYLNGYGDDPDRRTEVPPGWTDWQTMIHVSVNWMYGYTISANGQLVRYGTSENDYQTDVLAERAVSSIRRFAGTARPFLMWVTPLAPHMEREIENVVFFGPRAAPRHEGSFSDEPLPFSPSYNEADVSDKPSAIARLPSFAPADTMQLTTRYRDALESLLAVDDLVERVVSELDSQGLLPNTVLVFTSDNGLFRGEHRLISGKELLYEESGRVPLVIRGPGFPAGTITSFPNTNADLSATIVDIADATPTHPLDGVSLLGLLADPDRAARRAVLLESRDASQGKAYWDGIRTGRYAYIEWGSPTAPTEYELYDLVSDPFQLDNLAGAPQFDATQTALRIALSQLKDCSGANCDRQLP